MGIDPEIELQDLKVLRIEPDPPAKEVLCRESFQILVNRFLRKPLAPDPRLKGDRVVKLLPKRRKQGLMIRPLHKPEMGWCDSLGSERAEAIQRKKCLLAIEIGGRRGHQRHHSVLSIHLGVGHPGRIPGEKGTGQRLERCEVVIGVPADMKSLKYSSRKRKGISIFEHPNPRCLTGKDFPVKILEAALSINHFRARNQTGWIDCMTGRSGMGVEQRIREMFQKQSGTACVIEVYVSNQKTIDFLRTKPLHF